MSVSVNDVGISGEEIARGTAHHADARSPRDAAACALAIRALLLLR